MLNIGTVVKDRYEILQLVGKGGMSTVYKARCLQDGKILAVKDMIRTENKNNQAVEQTLNASEGRMLMQLSNPHLPKIYDIIESEDSIMIVMDFIAGESLDKVIARTGPQKMENVLDWGMQICIVFDYLHNQPEPIIYRDMKPANVMLQPNGQIMMIDFGTARREKVGVMMQEDTVCIGTAGFAAPEQFGGFGQSTAKTDIFCLGATLYNMITGHSPCDPPKGILPLERWDPALKKCPLADIIYKCTRNDPNERYQTAMELYQDLYMARMGMHKPGLFGKSAKTAQTDGAVFQQQRVKQYGGAVGLSGLLKKNTVEKKTDTPNTWQTVPNVPAQSAGAAQWQGQMAQQQSAAQVPQQVPQAPQQVPQAQQHAPQAQQQPVQPSQQSTPYVPQRTVAAVPQQYATPAQQWQQPAKEMPNYGQADPAIQYVPQNTGGIWGKLTLIAAIIAALFVIIGVVLMVLQLTTLSLVLLICAVGAVFLALIGAILSKTSN